MVKIERTLTIDCPVTDVFAYLSDVAHRPRYVSSQREAHQTSTGPVAVGTTFVATSSKFPHRGTTFEITEYEPDRRLAWKSLSGTPITTSWGFQPSGANTRISFSRLIERHGLLRLPESLVEELANESVSRELAALNRQLDVGKPAARDSYLRRKGQ